MGDNWKLILIILSMFVIISFLELKRPSLVNEIINIGILYGGGIVIVNYSKSIVENMIKRKT